MRLTSSMPAREVRVGDVVILDGIPGEILAIHEVQIGATPVVRFVAGGLSWAFRLDDVVEVVIEDDGVRLALPSGKGAEDEALAQEALRDMEVHDAS